MSRAAAPRLSPLAAVLGAMVDAFMAEHERVKANRGDLDALRTLRTSGGHLTRLPSQHEAAEADPVA
jgi:hypothetical protein